MSDIKKRFSRRDFMKFASGTAMTLPLLAACADTATEAPVVDDNGGETGLVEGQRGGLWLPPEQPELKEISASLDNPNFYTVVHWHLINDFGYARVHPAPEPRFYLTFARYSDLVEPWVHLSKGYFVTSIQTCVVIEKTQSVLTINRRYEIWKQVV